MTDPAATPRPSPSETIDARPTDRERIPPGQFETKKFPVLTYGDTPTIERTDWSIEILGLVEERRVISWRELERLPRVTLTADFHCVTTWSQLDLVWEGVSVLEVLKLAPLKPEARFVLAHSYGGYSTNLPLDDFFRRENLIAFRVGGKDLAREHGGPVRLLVPHLYAWKSAKWIRALEFLPQDTLGFWERYGYHAHGDPWTEERFG